MTTATVGGVGFPPRSPIAESDASSRNRSGKQASDLRAAKSERTSVAVEQQPPLSRLPVYGRIEREAEPFGRRVSNSPVLAKQKAPS